MYFTYAFICLYNLDTGLLDHSREAKHCIQYINIVTNKNDPEHTL